MSVSSPTPVRPSTAAEDTPIEGLRLVVDLTARGSGQQARVRWCEGWEHLTSHNPPAASEGMRTFPTRRGGR
eukprot:5627369-Pyramimonas_sp.AAC.1